MQSSLPESKTDQIDLKPCHHAAKVEGLEVKFNFYHCEIRDTCVRDRYKSLVDNRFRFEGAWDLLENEGWPTCALDLANTCSRVGLKKLAEEAIEKIGYTVRSVEWRILWLNTQPGVINIEGEPEPRTTDLIHINKRCKIIPLEFAQKPEITKPYHLRSSSAFYECTLERFLACLNKQSLPIEITDGPISLAGRDEHELQNGKIPDSQLIHENLLVEAGLVDKPIPREKYCEIKLEYDYVAPDGKSYVTRGKPDAILKIIDKKTGNLEGLCILDFKHAQYGSYEKPAYKMQMLSYALAVTQMLNINPKYFLLISQRSPFEEHPDSWRKPSLLLTMVPNNPSNKIIQEFHRGIEKYVGFIWDTVTNIDVAAHCKENFEARVKDGCCTKGRDFNQVCFQKTLCDYLLGRMSEENTSLLDLLKANKWLPPNLAYQ